MLEVHRRLRKRAEIVDYLLAQGAVGGGAESGEFPLGLAARLVGCEAGVDVVVVLVYKSCVEAREFLVAGNAHLVLPGQAVEGVFDILYKYMVVAAAGAFEVPVFGDSLVGKLREEGVPGAEVREVLKLAAGLHRARNGVAADGVDEAQEPRPALVRGGLQGKLNVIPVGALPAAGEDYLAVVEAYLSGLLRILEVLGDISAKLRYIAEHIYALEVLREYHQRLGRQVAEVLEVSLGYLHLAGLADVRGVDAARSLRAERGDPGSCGSRLVLVGAPDGHHHLRNSAEYHVAELQIVHLGEQILHFKEAVAAAVDVVIREQLADSRHMLRDIVREVCGEQLVYFLLVLLADRRGLDGGAAVCLYGAAVYLGLFK